MALIKCRECGKEISNTAKICPFCGIENDVAFCPECHKEISKNVEICPHCGVKIKRISGSSILLAIVLGIYSISSIYSLYILFNSLI